MNASPHPIEQSFELAAMRCTDLTPFVYQRLFKEHPEAQAMFRSQGSGLVKIEAIVDFAGERSGHQRATAISRALADWVA